MSCNRCGGSKQLRDSTRAYVPCPLCSFPECIAPEDRPTPRVTKCPECRGRKSFLYTSPHTGVTSTVDCRTCEGTGRYPAETNH